MGGWAKEDTDVLMDDATTEDAMCNGKCSCKTHSEGRAVAANDLLIENEKLQAKLEDQEAELTEALQQIMSTKVELEHFKNQYVSMERALKQAHQEANTHGHATQELISSQSLLHRHKSSHLLILQSMQQIVSRLPFVAAQGEHEEETVMKHVTQA